MCSKKVELGQFFTRKNVWLKPQVIDFIHNSGCDIAYDPFAGGGDLLDVSRQLGFIHCVGLDIDSSLLWQVNDSLHHIPCIEDAIIITNPPYLAKQSASRKNLDLSRYFSNSRYDDLYLIALDKMLCAQEHVVAIIPESFINSNFLRKDRLHSITILEENPFTDTENPVCVVCFDGVSKERNKISVYKNEQYIGNYEELNAVRIYPNKSIDITFNDLGGWLGLRAIDSTNDINNIAFGFKEDFDYNWEKNIKVSSRHMSLISVDIPHNIRGCFIKTLNEILNKIRVQSCDVLLTPFKGNRKSGVRRRRLDFSLARAIIEKGYDIYIEAENDKKELRLF